MSKNFLLPFIFIIFIYNKFNNIIKHQKMANVNQYHTHYQETIKLTKVQSKTIRTVLKNAVLSIEARVKNVKNYLDTRGVNYNLAVNDQETLIRVNANNALPTTYYFHTPSQIKS